uniref:Cytochrome b6-f complex iron-sulfur subunit 1, cyanelle n=1 Tax=Cyanophora paradoxa TaxID=2762 RepID=UCRIA_CYAPA|nr:RecName: Full=Cytochrome b6-f complex iron-sulfur subunit 1, cyanelle; AltName: Full=Plastohydroquinone:plastocyanin oxidoreductase iron-sulfur protein 1; AltName: Full=Rieske iron-sulfur protein 1; Short=ISP 1; Short=RISP 1; Flags: Precursor [Cyanophora paradoxa]CAH04960.1 Rieske iron-sulphur protein [Cyanophora paradoxa]|eukprot:tig00000970_g5838.t1
MAFTTTAVVAPRGAKITGQSSTCAIQNGKTVAVGTSKQVGSFKPVFAAAKPAKETTFSVSCSAASDDVPDMGKRKLMNLLLLGAIAGPVAGAGGPFVSFLVPPKAGGGAGAGQAAKDALGNDVKVSSWLETHKPGDRSLAQGLKGDATYLIVKEDGTLENYGLNAVCTHLGCVVPWNASENKFMCPCHGSQYDRTGKVVRGPAPLSLALAHVSVLEDGVVAFEPWTETDFRTNTAPWWK